MKADWFVVFAGGVVILMLLIGCSLTYDPMPKWSGYQLEFKDNG